MRKIKEELRDLKPKLLLISFAVVLFFVAIRFDDILGLASRLLSYLSPLVIAIGLAFALNVPMRRIEKFINSHSKDGSVFRRFSRGIAIVGAIVIVVVLFVFLGMIVVPEFFASIGNFFLNLSVYINNISENIYSVLKYFNIDYEQITNSQIENFFNSIGLNYSDILKQASNWILGTGQGTVDYIMATGNYLFMLMMSFTISIYLLASKETFIRQLKKVTLAIFPSDIAEDIFDSSKVANDIFSNFIGGKCVECVVVGVMVYAIMAVFKMPFAILIACLCGALTIISVFGSLVATIIGCLLLLSVNIWYPIFFFFIYWFVQIVDGNFIYPNYIGSNMGLPAVWILTSVLVFGSVYGFIGALLAAPTTACLYTFFANYINKKLNNKHITVDKDGNYTQNDN